MTGAAGLTGGAVTAELVRRGHRVIGITRTVASAERVRAHGAEAVVGDCADAGTMRAILGRCDALVHVAGILLGEDLARADLSGMHRTIVVSTASVYSRTRASAAAYRRNEDALRSAQPAAVFIRPTMIYGSPRDRNVHLVIAFASRWRVLPIPVGRTGRIQPIHYADLATAIASLVDGDASGAIDAGGPSPITVGAAAQAIAAAVGGLVLAIPVPLGPATVAAGAVDLVGGGRWRERLARMREDRTVDNGRLLALTGVRLRSFEDGLRAEVAEMRARVP